MLYKYDALAYVFEVGAGMRQATRDGASCINISGGYPCNILLDIGPDFNICTAGGRAGICAVVTAAAATAAAAVCAATAWIPFAGAIACGAATSGVVAATTACLSTLAFGNLASPMRSGAIEAFRNGVPVVVSAGNALSRETLPEVIRDLVARGATLVLTTQYLEEADHLADDIVVIDHGREIAHGTADQLKAQVGGERLLICVDNQSDLPALDGIPAAVA